MKINPQRTNMQFSERYGYKSVRQIIQTESIDEPLRNALWSLLKIFVWDHVQANAYRHGYSLSSHANHQIKDLCEKLWFHYFKKPLDQLDNDWEKVNATLRKYFFESQWYETYDFIEFIANHYKQDDFENEFIESCNRVLEREMSAYRFVDGTILRITEQEEINEIEEALGESHGPVVIHLRRALELLSNRDNPDYRNSIKESISAVESLVGIMLGGEKGTLGQLLKKLEGQIGLHPALKAAFSSLYGYTSDEGGIRHALLEPKDIFFEDAKFFLVTCSAFVNFVKMKNLNSHHPLN